MRILAISGSLRAASSNTVALRAAARLAPPDVEIVFYTGLATLPHFNPDDDDAGAPDEVLDFRAQLRGCDALLISTPEYAHGVPGSLKNALDWVVGSGELIDKPVGLINTAALASLAQASLAETLRVMSARLVEGAMVTFPLGGKRTDSELLAQDETIAPMLRGALAALQDVAGKA
jgi:chromate reductase, NAD(P)H dehydrogenase (quinone)